MRLSLAKTRQANWQIRARGTLETRDPFVTQKKVAKTVFTKSTEPERYDQAVAAQRARNMGVATRSALGSQELKVNPELTVERAALHLGPLTVFRTAETILIEAQPVPVALDMASLHLMPIEFPSQLSA